MKKNERAGAYNTFFAKCLNKNSGLMICDGDPKLLNDDKRQDDNAIDDLTTLVAAPSSGLFYFAFKLSFVCTICCNISGKVCKIVKKGLVCTFDGGGLVKRKLLTQQT